MTNKEAIRILRDSAETASIFEIAEAVDLAIEALKEAGRYEQVELRRKGASFSTALKDNATQGYFMQYITMEAARYFGIEEVKQEEGGDQK